MAGAVPLCIPNNFYWNAEAKKLFKQDHENRTHIVLCQDGLDVLTSLSNEPVAVLCIAGPARTGKSYILSQMQHDLQFELGHTMTSHTTGIWINENPELIQLHDGTSARLILVDTEGIGAAASSDDQANAKWDNQIFTLSALISSLLVYNIIGTCTARDLETLYFITNLAQSIFANVSHEEKALVEFRECSPDFIWLFRDLLLQPTDANRNPCDLKTFLEQRILKINERKSDQSMSDVKNKQIEIRKYLYSLFPTFDAFGIPPPSTDEQVVQNMSNPTNQSKISKIFLRKVQELRDMIMKKLRCKHMKGMSYLTGKQLAILLQSYVKELNQKGSVPEWNSAWEDAIRLTQMQAMEKTRCLYMKLISSTCSKKNMPLSESDIMKCHTNALKHAMELFKTETKMICNSDMFIGHAKEVISLLAVFDPVSEMCIGGELLNIFRENEDISDNFCNSVFQTINLEIVEPILDDLDRMTCETISEVLCYAKSWYLKEARGPKIRSVLLSKLPEIENRLNQAMQFIQSSEDYEQQTHMEMFQRMNCEVEIERKLEEAENLNELIKTQKAQCDEEVCLFKQKQQETLNEISALRHKHQIEVDRLKERIKENGPNAIDELFRLQRVHDKRIQELKRKGKQEWRETCQELNHRKEELERKHQRNMLELENRRQAAQHRQREEESGCILQ